MVGGWVLGRGREGQPLFLYYICVNVLCTKFEAEWRSFHDLDASGRALKAPPGGHSKTHLFFSTISVPSQTLYALSIDHMGPVTLPASAFGP